MCPPKHLLRKRNEKWGWQEVRESSRYSRTANSDALSRRSATSGAGAKGVTGACVCAIEAGGRAASIATVAGRNGGANDAQRPDLVGLAGWWRPPRRRGTPLRTQWWRRCGQTRSVSTPPTRSPDLPPPPIPSNQPTPSTRTHNPPQPHIPNLPPHPQPTSSTRLPL